MRRDCAGEDDVTAAGVIAIVRTIHEKMLVQIKLDGLNLSLGARALWKTVAIGALRLSSDGGRTTRAFRMADSSGRSGCDPKCQQRCQRAISRQRCAPPVAPDRTKGMQQADGALNGSLVSRCGFDARMCDLLQRTIPDQSLGRLQSEERQPTADR